MIGAVYICIHQGGNPAGPVLLHVDGDTTVEFQLCIIQRGCNAIHDSYCAEPDVVITALCDGVDSCLTEP
jgi:hypothetical protein